jgi:NAD(P)H-dependent flavin oxidoreductase YrpB (nitropropane dioxygenase family)
MSTVDITDATDGLATRFTRLVGCTVPIQLAPMGGGVVTSQLVTAVCRAGGLGMVQGRETRPLAERLDALTELDGLAFGVNFVSPKPADRELIELAAARARLVEFTWTQPDPRVVEWAHGAGALAGWQVGSLLEAKQAVDAGCDLVVVQGFEAGGHVRSKTALLPLLATVLDHVDVPTLAAGGIATGRSMAAVLAAGADGVRIGTRFLATVESGAHPAYVEALLAAGEDATVMTTAFSVGWPDAPHRVLRAAVDAATAHEGDAVGSAGEVSLPRWSSRTPSRDVTGDVSAMALYAGEGVAQVNEVVPAAQVMAELVASAAALLRS